MSNTYVYLPSNSNNKNTTSSFTTDLDPSFSSNRYKKVALVEVIYKHSWNINLGFIIYTNKSIKIVREIDSFHDSEKIGDCVNRINENLKKLILIKLYNERFVEFDKFLKQKEKNPESKLTKNQLFPDREYEEGFLNEKVIEEIKSSELEYTTCPYLYFQNNLLRIKFDDQFRGTIQFSGKVVKILELEEERKYISKIYKNIKLDSFILSENCNPFSSVDIVGQIFIYAPNLIEGQFIGNIKTPLLAIIVVEPNSFNKTIKVTLDPPHYLNINQTEIRNIKIDILDQFGEKILFEDSTVTLKLDFI